MSVLAIASAFVACLNPQAVDGDNIRCDGVNMRVVGVNARERDGSCFASAPCPAMGGDQARQAMQQLVERGVEVRLLYTDPFGRPVIEGRLQDGRDLSCALIARGAAVRYERYWPAGKRCG